MSCAGCGLEIVDAEGYGSFTWGYGRTALEQVQNYRTVRYCGVCAKALRSHLGLPDIPPIPEPPIACQDERVNF